MAKKKTKKEVVEATDEVVEEVTDEVVEDAKEEPKEEVKEVKPVDVKYRVTFLEDQRFKGLFRPRGTSIVVPSSIAKAYGKRSTLKFEPIKV